MKLAEIEKLDKQLDRLEKKRNKALRTFRLRCKHLILAEVESMPPWRICINCGAQEEGWHCGYQVLALQRDRTDKVPNRSIIPNCHRDKLAVLHRCWPMYYVGQSHPLFSAKWDYKSLTSIEPIK